MCPEISLHKQPLHLVKATLHVFLLYWCYQENYSGSWSRQLNFLFPEANPLRLFQNISTTILRVYITGLQLIFLVTNFRDNLLNAEGQLFSLFLYKKILHSDSRCFCSSKQNNEVLPLLLLLLRVFGFRSKIILQSFWITKAFFSVHFSIILPLSHRSFLGSKISYLLRFSNFLSGFNGMVPCLPVFEQ